MPESLLSFSAILLFGRKLDDIVVVENGESDPEVSESAVVLTRKDLPAAAAGVKVKGIRIREDEKVLVKHRSNTAMTGLWKLDKSGTTFTWQAGLANGTEAKVRVVHTKGKHDGYWNVSVSGAGVSTIKRIKTAGQGNNNFISDQLDEDACFARVYGFSYEGDYFDLPSPTLFLVHGDGELASQKGKDQSEDNPSNRSRAPRDPSIGGMAAANFQFADDIRVWNYDKADYTIRMDVASGMFEQVLLDATLGDGSFGVSGAKVSGAKVSGAKVSGAKVSGAKVSGAKARGPGD